LLLLALPLFADAANGGISDVFVGGRRACEKGASLMPEKTIKRRLAEAGARDLADDDRPIFSVAKLVDALQRAVPHSRDLGLREEATGAPHQIPADQGERGDLAGLHVCSLARFGSLKRRLSER
jgi:hypothetical protein